MWLKIGVHQHMPKPWSHTKFQPNRLSSSREMAENPKIFGILFHNLHEITHFSGTTGRIWLKFGVGSGFGHGLLHPKFLPIWLKNAIVYTQHLHNVIDDHRYSRLLADFFGIILTVRFLEKEDPFDFFPNKQTYNKWLTLRHAQKSLVLEYPWHLVTLSNCVSWWAKRPKITLKLHDANKVLYFISSMYTLKCRVMGLDRSRHARSVCRSGAIHLPQGLVASLLGGMPLLSVSRCLAAVWWTGNNRRAFLVESHWTEIDNKSGLFYWTFTNERCIVRAEKWRVNSYACVPKDFQKGIYKRKPNGWDILPGVWSV